jgi:hypothetical protein
LNVEPSTIFYDHETSLLGSADAGGIEPIEGGVDTARQQNLEDGKERILVDCIK